MSFRLPRFAELVHAEILKSTAVGVPCAQSSTSVTISSPLASWIVLSFNGSHFAAVAFDTA
jgi:hypothetical protein